LNVGGASSGRGHGERVEREPITGVWGRSPSGVQGQSFWWGVRRAKPPEAVSFLVLKRPTERQNSKMSKSIRLSLTSQCRRLNLWRSKSYGLLSRAKSWGSSCSLCSPCSNAHDHHHQQQQQQALSHFVVSTFAVPISPPLVDSINACGPKMT